MDKSVSRKVVSCFVALLAGSGCGSGATGSAQLAGTWDSAGCETYPSSTGDSVYLKRRLNFTSTDVTLTTMLYNEKGCLTAFATSVFTARYSLGMPSATAAGASEIDYSVTTRAVTPLTSNAVSALSSGVGGTCGSGSWTINQSGDVGGNGCPVLGIPSLAACPRELDLIKVDGNSLSTGDRTVVDACKTRPTALITQAVVKSG